MRINSISDPRVGQFSPVRSATSSSFEYDSTIQPSVELANKTPSSILSLFNVVKTKLINFFKWLFSWFPFQKSKNEECDFFRLISKEEGKIGYGFTLDGNKTKNQIKFGKTQAFLEQLSFPDKKQYPKLSKLLTRIMEEEKISAISTSNLGWAKILWDCGLTTQKAIVFKPGTNDRFNQMITKTLSRAFKKKQALNDPIKEVLNEIEEKLVKSIITEATSFGGSTNQFAQAFNPQLARAQMDIVEKALKHPFDVKALIKKIGEENDPASQMFVEALQKIDRLTRRTNPASQLSQTELELSLNDLFLLMDETQTLVDRGIIQEFTNINFLKKD